MNFETKGLSWQLNVVLLSIIISVAIYVGVSIFIGWQDVVNIFQKVGWLGLFVALVLSFVNYVLRFGRWQIYLKKLGYVVQHWLSWKIYLSGFALTTTPGKAGEAIRSIFLKKYGVSVSASLAAFISERFSDLIAIVLLCLIGLLQYPMARLPVSIAMILIVCAWLVLAYRPFVIYLEQFTQDKSGRIWQLLQKIIEIIKKMQLCHNITLVSITTLISLVAWGAEAVAFYYLLQWSGFDLGFNFAVFVYAIAMLAGALSFLPGGLGGAEATMVSLLMLKGLDLQSAFALTLFIRLTTLWFAVILGLLALLKLKFDEKQV